MSTIVRQQIAAEVRRKANRYVDKAFATIEKIMDSDTAPSDVRLRAATVLLDRAAGKPSQEVIMEGVDNDEYDQQFAQAAQQTDELLALPPPSDRPLEQEILPPEKKPVGNTSTNEARERIKAMLNKKSDNVTTLRPKKRDRA